MPDWFTPFLIALDALVCYRLTRLVVEDRVPFGPLRDRICARWPGTRAEELVTCPWCMSMWLAPAVLGAHALAPGVWPYAAALLALSALAGLLATWEGDRG